MALRNLLLKRMMQKLKEKKRVKMARRRIRVRSLTLAMEVKLTSTDGLKPLRRSPYMYLCQIALLPSNLMCK